MLLIPRSKAAPERGFVQMWRRTWAVDRAVAALNTVVIILKMTAIALIRARCYMRR